MWGCRYLFAICAAGRLSNRLRCFHIYMGLAALLNRTLVVPYKDIGSSAFSSNVCDFKWVFDVPHARTCFPRPPSGQAGEPAAPSPPVMLTFYEYLSQEQVEEMKLKVCASGTSATSAHPPFYMGVCVCMYTYVCVYVYAYVCMYRYPFPENSLQT